MTLDGADAAPARPCTQWVSSISSGGDHQSGLRTIPPTGTVVSCGSCRSRSNARRTELPAVSSRSGWTCTFHAPEAGRAGVNVHVDASWSRVDRPSTIRPSGPTIVRHRPTSARSNERPNRTTSRRSSDSSHLTSHCLGSTRVRIGSTTRQVRSAPVINVAPAASRIRRSTAMVTVVPQVSGGPASALGCSPRLMRPGSNSAVNRRRGRSHNSGGMGSRVPTSSRPSSPRSWRRPAALPSSIGAEKSTEMRSRLAGTLAPPGSIRSTWVLGSMATAGTPVRASSVHRPPVSARTAWTVSGTAGNRGLK